MSRPQRMLGRVTKRVRDRKRPWWVSTAQSHAAADARCGRDWLAGGCCCGACRSARADGWCPVRSAS